MIRYQCHSQRTLSHRDPSFQRERKKDLGCWWCELFDLRFNFSSASLLSSCSALLQFRFNFILFLISVHIQFLFGALRNPTCKENRSSLLPSSLQLLALIAMSHGRAVLMFSRSIITSIVGVDIEVTAMSHRRVSLV